MHALSNNSGVYIAYKSELDRHLEYRYNKINKSKLILRNSQEFEEFKTLYILSYVEDFYKLNENARQRPGLNNQEKKNILTVDNFIDEFQFNFSLDCWLDLMERVSGDLRKKENQDLLKVFKTFLFSSADVSYFSKFFKEVSLEEKARGDGFSFPVHLFKPLKRSVLFN
jgi:hypothetical protein